MSLALSSQNPGQSGRFQTRRISVGNLGIGGHEPIVIQSMTTTDTMNVEATYRQVVELAKVGCQMVRITAPTIDDAKALGEIRKRLDQAGVHIPLVADIHFLPKAAEIAADFVEKVRINPGNFADRKMFKVREYSDEEYRAELDRIREKFEAFVLKLKRLSRALRIGTNHGSLSDRIMNRFGDTPLGMVESAFEYAQICRDLDFHNFCFSMKASNVRVMVEAYRLLVKMQKERGWDYPIHLGVTEAGEGEDARMKSAIGIGTLLAEGIGDTVRVSLTEDSVNEIPVAKAIAERFSKKFTPVPQSYSLSSESSVSKKPLVCLEIQDEAKVLRELSDTALRPDIALILKSKLSVAQQRDHLRKIFQNPDLKIAITDDESWAQNDRDQADYVLTKRMRDLRPNEILQVNGIEELKSIERLDPGRILLCWDANAESLEDIIELSFQIGTPLIDLAIGAVMIRGLSADANLRLSFNLLQATRRRMSKTEYIACPSCGRTLFDLQETTARIKAVTSHLKDVKIAVMGCIVNGPGEMADADFGYVGGAPGRVNLYVQKECVERNIPSEEAPLKLVELIKAHGKWQDPPAV